MVNVRIYIEGVQSQNPAVLTVDSSAVFRENFHKLFSRELSPTEFNLSIIPFGSITLARKMLEQIAKNGINAVLLVDLDAPRNKREERLNYYKPHDTNKIFFMIQEMEAWILSQIEKIERFGRNEGLIRKKANEDIANNHLIKDKHPETINKPGEKLDTILRRYFDVGKIRIEKFLTFIFKTSDYMRKSATIALFQIRHRFFGFIFGAWF